MFKELAAKPTETGQIIGNKAKAPFELHAAPLEYGFHVVPFFSQAVLVVGTPNILEYKTAVSPAVVGN